MAPVRLGRALHAGTARGGVARRRSAADSRFRAGVHPLHPRARTRHGRMACDSASRLTPNDGPPCAPYFDNQLDPFALLPDLTPDRIRLAPHCIGSERTRGKRAQALYGFAHGLGNAGVVASGRRYSSARRACEAGISRCRSLRAWRGRDREPACRRWPAGTRDGRARRSISNRLQITRETRVMERLLLARPARQLDLGFRQR